MFGIDLQQWFLNKYFYQQLIINNRLSKCSLSINTHKNIYKILVCPPISPSLESSNPQWSSPHYKPFSPLSSLHAPPNPYLLFPAFTMCLIPRTYPGTSPSPASQPMHALPSQIHARRAKQKHHNANFLDHPSPLLQLLWLIARFCMLPIRFTSLCFSLQCWNVLLRDYQAKVMTLAFWFVGFGASSTWIYNNDEAWFASL